MTKAETVKASLPREPKTKARANPNRSIDWATFEEIKQGQKKLATTVKPSGGA